MISMDTFATFNRAGTVWEKDNIFLTHIWIFEYSRHVMAAYDQAARARIHAHTPARLNAAWQTLSPIGLRDRLSTLRSSWVALPSVGERVSRRCPLACRARDKHNGVNWQLSMKSLDSSRWFYVIALGTVTRAQSSQSAVVSCIKSNRISKYRKTTEKLHARFYELEFSNFLL